MSSKTLMYVAGLERGVQADRRLVDRDHPVEMGKPFQLLVRPGVADSAVQIAAERFLEDIADQRTLTRARHPGDAHEQAQRYLDVDVLQVVVRGPADHELLAVGGSAFRGHGDLFRPGEILPGDALRLGHHLLDRPRSDHGAPAHAGPRSEIDDVVGRPHRVLVVLHHDDRVSLIAEPGQRLQKPVVVARVQPDRRLIQDVEHADQPAADLPGQPDPLQLAAGKRGRRTVEREVLEAHVLEEREPAADLLEGLDGDHLSEGVQGQFAEELLGVGDRQGADFRQRAGAIACQPRRTRGELDRARLGVEPLAAAPRTADDAHVLLQHPPLHPALRAAILRKQFGNDPLVLAAPLVPRRAAPPREGDVLFAGPVEYRLLDFRVELLPGRLQHGARLQAVSPLQVLGHSPIKVAAPTAHLLPVPDQLDAPLLKRSAGVRDQPRGVKTVDLAQPVAVRAHPLRTVETEQLRAGRLEAQLAVRAGVMSREMNIARPRWHALRWSPAFRRFLFLSLSPCSRTG